jgi:hypothetical protein
MRKRNLFRFLGDSPKERLEGTIQYILSNGKSHKQLVKEYQLLQEECKELIEGKVFFDDYKACRINSDDPQDIASSIYEKSQEGKKRQGKGPSRYMRRKSVINYKGRMMSEEWGHLKFTADLIRDAQNADNFDVFLKRELGLTFEEFTTILVITLQAWFFYFMGYSKEKPDIPSIIEQKINGFYKPKRKILRDNASEDIEFEKSYIALEMLKTFKLLMKTCYYFFNLLCESDSIKIKRYVVYFWQEQAYLILDSEWKKYKGNYFKRETIRKQIESVDDYVYKKYIGIPTASKTGQFYSRNKPVYITYLASTLILGFALMAKGEKFCRDIIQRDEAVKKIQKILDDAGHLKSHILNEIISDNS